MITVLFEVRLREEKKEEYLDIATQLRSELSQIKGFISIERFVSMLEPTKLLSLSFWEDEESVKQWRNIELHRMAQKEGRNSLFENYRIRVANVMRDYSMTDREEAPSDSKSVHQ